MKIDDDHMYHGAALTQIAEHPQFTAINHLTTKAGTARSSFLINSNIGIYIKYATRPEGSYSEYRFTFSTAHLTEIVEIKKKTNSVHIVLVCVLDREICGLDIDSFNQLIEVRRSLKGSDEERYTIAVTAPKNKKMRAYVNVPGRKGKSAGEHLVARNHFPDCLFER